MKKEPSKGQTFIRSVQCCCRIYYSCFRPQSAGVNSQRGLRTKHRGGIQLQRVTGLMLDESVLEVKASDL